MNLDAFIAQHHLPAAFAKTASKYFMPLAQWAEQRIVSATQQCPVLGINGAQGTGKSTLSNFLVQYLHCEYERNVVELSIDDLYLTRAQRETLGRNVHPLLATRGVPGTHDIALGNAVICDLRALEHGQSVAVPRFNKAVDDRLARDDWPRVSGPVDLIVLEGWCVGAKPQLDHELVTPVNVLEQQEDADIVWRRYVNAQLAGDYQALFERIDALVYLAAPDFGAVQRWRSEQEGKLRRSAEASGKGVLDDAQILRFMQHFQRITQAGFASLPQQADVVIRLDNHHQACAMTSLGL